jgi:hypothetical protein
MYMLLHFFRNIRQTQHLFFIFLLIYFPCTSLSTFLFFKFIRHNIIHWGGNCGKNAQIPRISLAATFKAKKSTSTHLTSNGLLNNVFDSMKTSPSSSSSSSSFFNKHNGNGSEDKSESEMSTSNRVKLIASSLLMYSDWFDLEGSALPDDFYRLVGHPRPIKHEDFDSNDCEFDEPPPPSSSIETLYPTDLDGDAAPPVVAVVVENIITEEEFAEYTPSTEIVDV